MVGGFNFTIGNFNIWGEVAQTNSLLDYCVRRLDDRGVRILRHMNKHTTILSTRTLLSILLSI
jgi:hypothetical protein